MTAFSSTVRTLVSGLLLAGLAACSSGPQPQQENLDTLADWAYQQGDWEAAEQYYAQMTETAAQDSTAWRRMGNMRLRQDNLSGAADAYKTATLTQENDAKAHFNLATSYLMLARESLLNARENLPERDIGQFVIDAKLLEVDRLLNGPVAGITMPAAGVFR